MMKRKSGAETEIPTSAEWGKKKKHNRENKVFIGIKDMYLT